jgi:ABC-2 type transport system ATP-binding protein
MPILQVRDLIKEFPVYRGLRATLRHPFASPTKRVLKGISLDVRAGEVVGILGGNGAGKTTLLKIAGTLLAPTAGSVTVGGYDVASKAAKVKPLVAYSFAEDRSFYWRLNGYQNLEFFAALDGLHGTECRRAIHEIGERLNLDAYLQRPFSIFSTGVRQRFALARALLRRPRLLLLDEPTRSVDPAEAASIWSYLREELVEQQGVSIVVVTHQIEEAVRVCDRICVLDNGLLRDDVRPRDLVHAAEGISGITMTVQGFPSRELARLNLIRGVSEVRLSEVDGLQQIDVWSDGDDELPLAEVVAATTLSGAQLKSLHRGSPIQTVVSRLMAEPNGAELVR